MYMVMVVVADRFVSVSALIIVVVIMVVAMMVLVMAEMLRMARRVFHRTANTHGCHISGIQREHDGKEKRETRTHNQIIKFHKGDWI